MKRFTRSSWCIGSLLALMPSLAVTPVHAQDGKLSVAPVAVAVVSAAFDKDAFEMGRPLGGDAPVAIALLIRSGGPSIVRFSDDDSTIDALRDDRGADLLKADKPAVKDGFVMSSSTLNPFPEFSKDQKQALVEVRGEKAPTAGSKTITLKGVLVVETATGTEAVKVEGVQLQPGKLAAGDYDVAISEAGPSNWVDADQTAVTFRLVGVAAERFAGITFQSADGQTIEARQLSKMTMFNQTQVQFALPKATTAAMIELSFWTGFASVKVPVDATIALGL